MANHSGDGLTRRRFMGSVAAGAVSATAASCISRPGSTGPRRPNVVYVFSDEHRHQSMGITELPELHTPNMARLARQGVQFTHCISNYPVCSPHRAILMSGRWPYQQGVIDNNIPLGSDGATLGKAFLGAGYRTGYIGKWHLGGTRAEPFGFEESLIWTRTGAHWDKSLYHPREGEPVQPTGYNATLMTDQALDYIARHRDEPFFLMLSLNPPHANFLDAPEGKKALYPEGSLPRRPNVDLASAPDDGPPRIWHQNSWPYYQGYHAHVSAVDDELGRVMAALDTLGLAEDTILAYSSDHGSMLGSHGLGSKRQPYEESIRVPFLIRWPRAIPRNTKLGPLFGSIDIMPTLCGLCGLPIPPSCMGLDFSPALRGGRGPEPKSQFIMHISKNNASGAQNHPAPIFRGVRTPRHTYAVYADRPWCLFDNEQDPYQLRNLIDEAGQKPLIAELDGVLKQWLRRAGDPFPEGA
ncbi:MAG: sulfatase [Candidatus Hydrogenedentes bacterium]|nr:sulfatase [Candidatus Hydrogenedentota bacterium]